MIDNPLQTSNNVCEHRRPRNFPDGKPQRAFDDRTVVASSFRRSWSDRDRRKRADARSRPRRRSVSHAS